jgi:hypothetical protein
MHIVFYASAHGMGHLVRLAEVGRALLEFAPDCRLSYRGRVRGSLLSARVGRPFDDGPPEVDVGLVETDHATQDLDQTARRGESLLQTWDARRSDEVAFLKQSRASAVVSDLPGIPLEAAAEIGIPGIGSGNFSWDWIYDFYHATSGHPVFARLADRLRTAYRTASCLARIAVGPPMSAFEECIDVGLVGRRGDRERAEALGRKYGLKSPCAFLAIQKAVDPRMLARGIERTPGVQIFGFLDLGTPVERYVRIDDEDQRFFPELVGTADFVMATLGHSILSECAVNGTPIITPPRLGYPEYDVLLAQGARFHPIVEIPLEDFRSGHWGEAMDRADMVLPPDPAPPFDGARRIAEIILERAKGA